MARSITSDLSLPFDSRDLNGWESNRFNVFRAGNYRQNIAEHEETGVKLWIGNPRGNNYTVKAGVSTESSESTHLARNLSSETKAVACILAFMAENDYVEVENGRIQDADGESIAWSWKATSATTSRR